MLPLVRAHGEVGDLGLLLEDAVVFALEEVIEPGVGEGVVVEAGVAHAAFADDGVLGCALVAAVEGGGDDGVLLILGWVGGVVADEVICGEVGAGGDVVPGHEPVAGDVDGHGVGLPDAAFAPGGIVGVRWIMAPPVVSGILSE